jgi:hypothetical protein
LRISTIKLGALCAVLLATGCQTASVTAPQANEAPPPANPAFAGEMNKFNAQFPNDKATKYEVESLRYSDDHKFDRKGDCHGKSIYPVTIVLLIDGKGNVTGTTTDVQNAKAACFRQAYVGVQMPKPPFAPYRKPILMK